MFLVYGFLFLVLNARSYLIGSKDYYKYWINKTSSPTTMNKNQYHHPLHKAPPGAVNTKTIMPLKSRQIKHLWDRHEKIRQYALDESRMIKPETRDRKPETPHAFAALTVPRNSIQSCNIFPFKTLGNLCWLPSLPFLSMNFMKVSSGNFCR